MNEALGVSVAYPTYRGGLLALYESGDHFARTITE
jgi:hypothetical protein